MGGGRSARRASWILGAALVAGVAGRAAAAPACLPHAIRRADTRVELDVGVVDGATVLCVSLADAGGFQLSTHGCWTVDLKKRALTARTPAALPGRGLPVDPAAACKDLGYCLPASVDLKDGPAAYLAPSTDGAHVALALDATIAIFDAKTKQLLRQIDPRDPKADGSTVVSNAMWGLAFVGDRIYYAGSDAGPFVGVWVFTDDGGRVGYVAADPSTPDAGPLSIYDGAMSVYDDGRIALSDAGLQHLTVVAAKDGTRAAMTRALPKGPCTDEDLRFVGESVAATARCKKYLAAKITPFVGATVAALPSGELIAALTGARAGQLVVLDPTSLAVKRTIDLPVCKK